MTTDGLPPNHGSNLVDMLIDTAKASAEDLRKRVSFVRLAPIDIAVEKNCECIYFDFDGVTYLGELRGRNRDFCISSASESEGNKGIAVRVLLDRHATKLDEKSIDRPRG